MEKEPASRRLPRPDLNIKPSTWSAAQTGGLASRVAIVATVAAIFGGISLVFVYPYFNIEQFRKWSMGKSNRTLIRLAISALSLCLLLLSTIVNINLILESIQKVNRSGIHTEEVQPAGKHHLWASFSHRDVFLSSRSTCLAWSIRSDESWMREKRFFVPTLVITVDVLDCLFFPSLYLVYKYLFPPYPLCAASCLCQRSATVSI